MRKETPNKENMKHNIRFLTLKICSSKPCFTSNIVYLLYSVKSYSNNNDNNNKLIVEIYFQL